MWMWMWRSTTRSITHLVPGPPPPHIDTSRSIVKGRLVKGRLAFGLIRHAARGFYTDQSDPTVCVMVPVHCCRSDQSARSRGSARASVGRAALLVSASCAEPWLALPPAPPPISRRQVQLYAGAWRRHAVTGTRSCIMPQYTTKYGWIYIKQAQNDNLYTTKYGWIYKKTGSEHYSYYKIRLDLYKTSYSIPD
jgi:hypothetical protein